MVNRTEVQLGDRHPVVGISNIEFRVENRGVCQEQWVIIRIDIDWEVTEDRRDVFWNDENAVDLVGQLAKDGLNIDSAPLELCVGIRMELLCEVFWFNVILTGLDG